MPDKGCVITWDFDVLKGDVIFSILRLRKPHMGNPREHRVHAGSVKDAVTTQFIDKKWTLGTDMDVIESAVVCKMGDSVQVSVVLQLTSVYCVITGFARDEPVGCLCPAVQAA